MKKYLIIFCILITSCASGPDYESEHSDYLKSVHTARETMSKPDLKKWLERQLSLKEQEFTAYGGLQDREEKFLGINEDKLSQSQGRSDVHQFNKETNELQMRRYNAKRKYLEKEIFLLKGLLSKYESPFVP